MARHWLLRVESSRFVAGAVYREDSTGWQCVKTAPILHELRRLTAAQACDYLRSRRWRWSWVNSWDE